MIKVADGWREGNVWYLWRSVRYALKGGMTIEETLPYLKEQGQELINRILRGKYTPSPVRRVENPKPDGALRGRELITPFCYEVTFVKRNFQKKLFSLESATSLQG